MENGLQNIRVNTSDVEKMRAKVPGMSDIERFNKVMNFYDGNYDKTFAHQIARDLKEELKEIFKQKNE